MSVTSLLHELSSHDLWTRIRAEQELVQHGLSAVEPLLAVLQNKDAPTEARWRAAGALGDIGSIRALHPLIAALKDEVWDVRQSAVWALGSLHHPETFAPLLLVVINPTPDEQIPYVSALMLAKIDRALTEDSLRTALGSSHWRVRKIARAALMALRYADVQTQPL